MRTLVQPGGVCSALRSLNDPIQGMRLRIRITILAGIVTMSLCGLWTWLPLEEAERTTRSIRLDTPSSETTKESQAAINLDAFAARLWNPPAGHVSREERTEIANRPTSIRLQLVGIISDGEQMTAAVYDETTDQLLLVKSGDSIRQFNVAAINAEGVELSDGRTTTWLALREDRS